MSDGERDEKEGEEDGVERSGNPDVQGLLEAELGCDGVENEERGQKNPGTGGWEVD